MKGKLPGTDYDAVYSPWACHLHAPAGAGVVHPIVSFGESVESGIDPDDRRAFAVDLDNLTIKGEHDRVELDPGDPWLPRRHGAWFARTVIDVKRRWGLTVDAAERDALEGLLGGPEAEQNCVSPTRLVLRVDPEYSLLEGGPPVTVYVELNAPAPVGGTRVTFTAEGTATLGDDFLLWYPETMIAEGETRGALEITAEIDAVEDDGETIILSASSTNPTLRTVEPVTLTIQDAAVVPALLLTGSVLLALLLFFARRTAPDGRGR